MLTALQTNIPGAAAHSSPQFPKYVHTNTHMQHMETADTHTPTHTGQMVATGAQQPVTSPGSVLFSVVLALCLHAPPTLTAFFYHKQLQRLEFRCLGEQKWASSSLSLWLLHSSYVPWGQGNLHRMRYPLKSLLTQYISAKILHKLTTHCFISFNVLKPLSPS